VRGRAADSSPGAPTPNGSSPALEVPNPVKPSRIRKLVVFGIAAAGAIAACAPAVVPLSSPTGSVGPLATTAASATSASASPVSATPIEPAVKLTVGLGYIPNVQFAQFYLADQAGYYRDAGLDVTFQNGNDPDLITLAAAGKVDVAIADGTSLIPAVSQGIPVRYLATIYAKFPNVVFAKETSGIKTAADLRGRTIGTPGKYGSGWIMLQALLSSAGLTPADTKISLYPDYGQLAGVEQDKVDAATGFANNEPIQLARTGVKPVVLTVDNVVPLQGNGLIAGTKTLETKKDAVALFISATLRAMEDISADPEKGLDAAIKVVPEIAKDREGQLAVLRATVDGWHDSLTDAQGMGAIDTVGWAKSIDFIAGLPGKLVPNPVTVDGIVDPSLLPVR
jgi:NitT/TauT family transport system substrate-binding protein